MEAAEGKTVVPIVVVRRADGGGIEVQVARERRVRVRGARPGVGGATGVGQSTTVRAGVASTDIPQRRKRNASKKSRQERRVVEILKKLN